MGEKTWESGRGLCGQRRNREAEGGGRNRPLKTTRRGFNCVSNPRGARALRRRSTRPAPRRRRRTSPRGTSRTALCTVPGSPRPSPSPRASTPRACAGPRMRCVSRRSSHCAQARRISAMKRSASCFNGVEWDGMERVVILVLVLPVLEYILLLIPFHSIRDIACFGRLVTTIRG